MPGGFCRIADQLDARAVSMGDGARAADVWVVSDKAVSTATLLPAVDNVRIRRIAGWVPSRAADNLFWLGRYLERAEATLRLVRALGTSQRDPGKGSSTRASLGRAHPAASGDLGRDVASGAGAAGEDRRRGVAKRERFGSALSLVRAAQRTATSLRERLSPDAWQVITEMTERLAAGSRRRRRRRQRRRTDAAGTGELCRARAGEHEPRRRLALSRNGPPRRACHQHRALCAPVRL